MTRDSDARDSDADARDAGGDRADDETVPVRVYGPDLSERATLRVPRGRRLRTALLAGDCSPYTALTRRANCGGRGLCATCGVWIDRGAPAPEHWHDRLAERFGFPRLSCRVTVDRPMTVRLPQKWLWGFGGRRRDEETD